MTDKEMLDKAVQNYSNCTCRCAYLTACDAATATAAATAQRLRSQKLHIFLWGLHVGLVL